jgi:PASTA domain-containing protein
MHRHLLGWLAVIALAVLLTTACGATRRVTTAASALPGCPSAAPRLTPPHRPHTPAPIIRPAATAAVICQYAPPLSGGKGGASPVRRLVLSGAAAAGLVAALDEAGPLTPHAARCDRPAGLLPFDQLVRLSYAGGTTSEALVTFTSCELAVVTAAGGSGTLTSPFQDDLFAYTVITAHDRGPRVPDVIGLSVSAAVSAARHHQFGLTVNGEVTDAAVPFGTVVFQTLPAGAIDAGPSPVSIGVFLAVGSASACRPGQLRLDYRAGGAGAGNDFGNIIFRDVARQPCRLTGRVAITGMDASGQAVTNTATGSVAPPGVLSPDTPRVRDGAWPQPASLVYLWSLIAEYRDAATPSGLCTQHVVPAAWRVRLPNGAVVMVPNADAQTPTPLEASGAFVTCRGQFGAASQLEFFSS